MDYLTSNFSDQFRIPASLGDIHHIFLMSSITGSIFLRIIDTEDFYHDHILIFDSGALYDFTIKNRTYFVLIYIDTQGEIAHYTNFVDQPIFRTDFVGHEFTVSNILTGMNLHTFSYYAPDSIADDSNRPVTP